MGKGHKQRERQVSKKQYDDNHDRIFKKNIKEVKEMVSPHNVLLAEERRVLQMMLIGRITEYKITLKTLNEDVDKQLIVDGINVMDTIIRKLANEHYVADCDK